MGAFWGVAQGSDEPPALIDSCATNRRALRKNRCWGWWAKAVTFDTGGISIKPADGMEKMKYDMAGGAAMIGVMRAIALLKPKIKVIGDDLRDGKYAVRQGAKTRRYSDRHVGQDD